MSRWMPWWGLAGLVLGVGAGLAAGDELGRKLIRLEPDSQGVFLAGTPVVVTVERRQPIRVLNWRRVVVHEGPAGLLPALPVGHYFAETKGDRTQFVILPADYAGCDRLGMEAPRADLTHQVTLVDRLQPGWVRVLSTANWWATVQPGPDQWNWAPLDSVVEHHQGRGRQVMVTAWLRPAWLTNDADFEPRFVEYARRLAERYRHRVAAIEIWNEPHWEAGWATHTAPEELPFLRSARDVVTAYRRLLCAAAPAIRAVNPEVQILAAAWTRPRFPDEAEGFGGGWECSDGVAFHDYHRGRLPPDQDGIDLLDGVAVEIGAIPTEVARFRKVVGSRLLFMNEGGLYGGSALGIANRQRNGTALVSGLEWNRGMARAVKYLLLYAAADVKVVIPHVLGIAATDPKNNLEIYGWELAGRGPHPKTSSLLLAGHWLNGARQINWEFVGKRGVIMAWQRGTSGTFGCAWAFEGQLARVAGEGLPGGFDIFGQTNLEPVLTEQPRFYRFGHVSPAGAIQALRAAWQ